jgi:lipoate-protein ligase A
MSELLLFVDLPRRGAENMRLDSMLLERCARAEITGAIRIYSFAPACLSLGRLQDERDVDRGACERDGVDVVRRPSGGRAVLHDHEVTYAVVCRASDTDFGGRVLEACARIHSAIATGLARIGANTRVRSLGDDERTAAKARAALADCFAKPSAHVW